MRPTPLLFGAFFAGLGTKPIAHLTHIPIPPPPLRYKKLAEVSLPWEAWNVGREASNHPRAFWSGILRMRRFLSGWREGRERQREDRFEGVGEKLLRIWMCRGLSENRTEVLHWRGVSEGGGKTFHHYSCKSLDERLPGNGFLCFNDRKMEVDFVSLHFKFLAIVFNENFIENDCR